MDGKYLSLTSYKRDGTGLDGVLIVPIYRLVQRLRGRLPADPDPVFLAITPLGDREASPAEAESAS